MSKIFQGNATPDSKNNSPDDHSNGKEWGPALWKIIHTMAAAYPDNPTAQVKASCRQFFYSLRHLLPCPTCRQHYTTILSKQQPQVNSAEDVQKWALWMHNEINARLKQGKPWTYDDLCSVYPPTDAGKDLEDTNIRNIASPSNSLQTILPNTTSQSFPNSVEPQFGVMRGTRRNSFPVASAPSTPVVRKQYGSQSQFSLQTPRPSSVKRPLKRSALLKKGIIKARLNSLRQYGLPGNIPLSTFPRSVPKPTPKPTPKRHISRTPRPAHRTLFRRGKQSVAQTPRPVSRTLHPITSQSKHIYNNNQNVAISKSNQEVMGRGKKKKKDCGCGK